MRPFVLAAVLLGGVSLSVIGCSYESKPPTGWQKAEAGPFSIFAPPGWKCRQLQGIDSTVGQCVGDRVELHFDFGQYSNPLDEAQEPSYVVAHENIGGFEAKMVSSRMPGHGVTGIYFRNVTGSNSLCLYGKDLTEEQQELALRIFRTVRFSDADSPRS
jgi:hypothetical protein